MEPPTATPVPMTSKPTARPAPFSLFTTYETRRERELAGESQVSPTLTSTTDRSTPALSPSSPLSLRIPRQRSVESTLSAEEHQRNASFADSYSSGPASLTTDEYLTPSSDPTPPWHLPTLILTTFPSTPDSGDVPQSYLRDTNNICIPGACESRWSIGSTVHGDDSEHEKEEKEERKTLSKRKKFMSIISLLSPTKEKEVEDQNNGYASSPPSPTNSSIYPPQESDSFPSNNAVINASTISFNPAGSTPPATASGNQLDSDKPL